MDDLHIKGNIAIALSEAGRKDEALALYEEILAHDPNNEITHFNIGLLSAELGNYERVVSAMQYVTTHNAASLWAHNHLGVAYMKLGRMKDAESALHKAVALDPSIPTFHINLGTVYRQMGKYAEAVHEYTMTIWLDPTHAEAFGNLGSTLVALGRSDEAQEHIEEAIKLKPDVPEFHFNFAMYYKEMGDLPRAIESFQKVATLSPHFHELWGNYYITKRQLCDWEHLERIEKHVEAMKNEEPFVSVMRTEDIKKNLESAQRYAQRVEQSVGGRAYSSYKQHGPRIKIGYLSGDFRHHPIGELVGSMFQYHDASTFEVIAYSYGINDGSEIRKTVEKHVDHFVDIRNVNYADAAERIHQDHIDILIDITGNTRGNRMEICALHPAKIQVSWLGFPGTTGASCFEYLIADNVVLPKQDEHFYTENIIRLPCAYQVNNATFLPSTHRYTRNDFGLPEKACVFVSFHQSYKIDPVVWKIWMRILQRVPGSVLFLWRQHAGVEEMLQKEAKREGVDPSRLVFGDTLPKGEHLERLGLTDLGLDTLVYNGHTTTSDCLWAGVPVVTLEGKHFASRVSSSILQEAQVPELVTSSPAEYEEKIVFLAQHPKEIMKLKRTLTHAKLKRTLYNTKRFVGYLEDAYMEMYEC